MRANDTSRDVAERMVEGYRRMTTGERAARVWELTRFAHDLVLADVRRRHPLADERECLLRAAARRLDPDLMRRAVGWDPRKEGY